MSTHKALYQPWREEAFRADEYVQSLSHIQQWMYRSLLQAAFYCSERPYLPDDDARLWSLAGCESREQWDQHKEAVRARFTPIELDGQKLLSHKKLIEDWDRALKTQLARAESGRKGGLSHHSETTPSVASETESGREDKRKEINKRSKQVTSLVNAKQKPFSPSGSNPTGAMWSSGSGLSSPVAVPGIPSAAQTASSGSPSVINSERDTAPEGEEEGNGNGVGSGQNKHTAQGLMKAVAQIVAAVLHRTSPALKNQEEKFDLILTAYGFNTVIADCEAWCRENVAAVAPSYPITDYLKVVDKRLGPKIGEPAVNVNDPRISQISAATYERTGFLPSVRSVATMLAAFSPKEILDAMNEFAGTLDEKEYKSAMRTFFADRGGSAVIVAQRKRNKPTQVERSAERGGVVN
jgi:hypothetical protein